MCGRFTLRTSPRAIAEHFGLYDIPDLLPRFNVAPTQSVAAVRLAKDGGGREFAKLHWGLIPWWSKDAKGAARLINARADTASSKPSFRSAFKSTRCLVAADGFFEWQKMGKAKQPYLITLRDESLFGFAGLWDRWKQPAGHTIESCTILTTEPNEMMAPLHDRMPVILPPSVYNRWLDPTMPIEELNDLLRPFPVGEMQARPVSTRVNNARNDDAHCLDPAA